MRVQGFWLEKTLPFDGQEVSEAQRGGPQHVQEAPENGTGKEKQKLSQMLLPSLILICLLDRFRRQRYQECTRKCKKNITVSEGMSKVRNGVSIELARADSGWPFRKPQKSKMNAICEPSQSGSCCFTDDRQKVTSKGSRLGQF